MKRLLTLILMAWVMMVGLGSVASVSAQSDGGALHLITSPLPINLIAQPGQMVTTELRIRNAGSKTETLKMGLLKFKAFGDSGSPKLLDREVGDDYFDWVTFSEKQFVIAPNEWHSVKMTISVPKSAAFGYYYAATFSRAQENTAADPQPQTALVGSTATLVLLEAQVPHARRSVTLDSFTTKPWYEFLPVTFTLKLNNTGNVHVAPSGNIFITSHNKPVATLDVNAAKGNILPSSARTFDSDWSDGFPTFEPTIQDGRVVTDAQGHPQKHLSWNFNQLSHLRFGKFQAHVTVVYDDGTKDVPVDATVEFWVFPWRLVVGSLLLILVIMGLGAGLMWLGQRLRRRND